MSGKTKSLLLILLLVLFSSKNSYAAIKDTDFDGVTDSAEISIYKTDPLKADTDGDGFPDGVEILNGTDPLNANSSPLQDTQDKSSALFTSKDPIVWYISRASGISAFILFSLAVSFGIIISSKMLIKYRVMNLAFAMEFHRIITWAGLFMVVLHFASYFFDQYIKLRVMELVVPFSFKRELISSVGVNISVPVSIGIVAFYLILVLISTSELRNKIVNVKIWRILHYLSFFCYLAFLAHGYFSGSDSSEVWMKVIYIASLSTVVPLIVVRIFARKLFYPKPISANKIIQ